MSQATEGASAATRAAIKGLLAKAREAKGKLLEAADMLSELGQLLDDHGKIVPKVTSMIRAAQCAERDADKLVLAALDRFMHVLALLEQALTDGAAFTLLVCASCGATVRITQRLALEVTSPKCVACAGDLVACET